jgi:hypothetical protein
VIDAAEFIGPYGDEKLGLNRIARFYYAPGLWEPSSRGGFIVDLRVWETLPAHHRNAVEAACAEIGRGPVRPLRRLEPAGAAPPGRERRPVAGLAARGAASGVARGERALRRDRRAQPAVPQGLGRLPSLAE